MSPVAVARELDDDPELTALECVTLLRYANAKEAFDNAQDETAVEKLKKQSDLVSTVERITFHLVQERRHRLGQHSDPVATCPLCSGFTGWQ